MSIMTKSTKLTPKQKIKEFYRDIMHRLTMVSNSIEAPESPIFSHGQPSINTSTKNLTFCKQLVKGTFFFQNRQEFAPTWSNIDNIITIVNGMGSIELGKIIIVYYYRNPLINSCGKGFSSVTFLFGVLFFLCAF